MKTTERNFAADIRFAKSLFGHLPKAALEALRELNRRYEVSVVQGDVKYLNGAWYVTHSGLLSIAERRRCVGIHVRPLMGSCNPATSQWVFRAVVHKSKTCKGFVGFGDADPSNVSPLMRGAEMRIAETRAVNRALRKAYGIGLCSVEEIGSSAGRKDTFVNTRKLPPQPAEGNGEPKLRDQLCLLIRQYRLDAEHVKQYAAEFCGTRNLRDASREQIASFVSQLAGMAAKNREALVCKLNSYAAPNPEEGAA